MHLFYVSVTDGEWKIMENPSFPRLFFFPLKPPFGSGFPAILMTRASRESSKSMDRNPCFSIFRIFWVGFTTQPKEKSSDFRFILGKSSPNDLKDTKTCWWFGTFFIFPYIGNNNPN